MSFPSPITESDIGSNIITHYRQQPKKAKKAKKKRKEKKRKEEKGKEKEKEKIIK
jgi:hypothetical protein